MSNFGTPDELKEWLRNEAARPEYFKSTPYGEGRMHMSLGLEAAADTIERLQNELANAQFDEDSVKHAAVQCKEYLTTIKRLERERDDYAKRIEASFARENECRARAERLERELQQCKTTLIGLPICNDHRTGDLLFGGHCLICQFQAERVANRKSEARAERLERERDELRHRNERMRDALEEAEAALIISVSYRSPMQKNVNEACEKGLQHVRAALGEGE